MGKVRTLRIATAGVIATGTLTGVVLASAPVGLADSPNCTVADMAGVAAGVSAATSAYLFTHPDFNAFVTGIKDQPIDEIRAQVRQYLDANPQTKSEIRAIRQPLGDLRARCDIASDLPLP